MKSKSITVKFITFILSQNNVKYCKNIRLDKDWIMACMLECFSDKWKRRDVAGFLAGYQTGQPLPVRAVSRMIQEKKSNVDPLLERAAEDLAREIKERDVHFPEIQRRHNVRCT